MVSSSICSSVRSSCVRIRSRKSSSSKISVLISGSISIRSTSRNRNSAKFFLDLVSLLCNVLSNVLSSMIIHLDTPFLNVEAAAGVTSMATGPALESIGTLRAEYEEDKTFIIICEFVDYPQKLTTSM